MAPVLFTVAEEGPIGSVVGHVRCVDKDVGDNAEVVYRVLGKVQLKERDWRIVSLLLTAQSSRRVGWFVFGRREWE
jgi:hypothetical protein